ncbi:hypothetical protein Q4R33_17120, partial [Morganella morganii subsp. sibonii]
TPDMHTSMPVTDTRRRVSASSSCKDRFKLSLHHPYLPFINIYKKTPDTTALHYCITTRSH